MHSIRGKRGFRVYLGKVYHGLFKAKADARAEVKKINATRASSSAGPVLMTHKHVQRTTVLQSCCTGAKFQEGVPWHHCQHRRGCQLGGRIFANTRA